jgi:hypothetical protein
LPTDGYFAATSSKTLRKKAIDVKTFALSTQVTFAEPRRARRRSAMRKANSAARAVPLRVICIVSKASRSSMTSPRPRA